MKVKNTKTKFDSSLNNSEFKNDNLSVIIRSHKKERMSFLDEALFSLAIQFWQKIEIIVVLQNGTVEFKTAVSELIKNQPFPENFKFQIHTVTIPAGVDGRSSLLTCGIKYATGRYLAFLDDDDVVYQHGYTTLINQLKEGKCAVAVGGCRMATLKNQFGMWHVQKKEKPFAWGRDHYDLFEDNFVPIHSYVIDRMRVEADDLYFDGKFPPLEDYDFLLRLAAKYEFDFSNLNVFVCEYRMHGDNSLLFDSSAKNIISDAHSKALKLIEERKKSVLYSIPIAHLTHILKAKTTALTHHETLMTKDDSIKTNVNPEDLKIFKRIFDALGYSIYRYFKHHPKIARRLGKATRYGWGIYSKHKFRDDSET